MSTFRIAALTILMLGTASAGAVAATSGFVSGSASVTVTSSSGGSTVTTRRRKTAIRPT